MTRKAFWKDYEEDANRKTRDEGANYKFVFNGRTKLGAFGYRPRNEPEDGEPHADLYSGDRMAKPFQGLCARWLNSQGSSLLATLGFDAQSLWD
jgi:hypothetical protein